MSNPVEKGPNVPCPHCHSKTAIFASREIAPLMRDIYYRCRNEVECGFRFVAQLVVKHSLTASARPNLTVVLPTYVAPQPKPRPANDDIIPPLPANDDDGDTAAEEAIVTAPS